MADMAGAFMRGYSFVDSLQRQRKQDLRLETLEKREDELYEKKKTEEAELQKGLAALTQALSGLDPQTKQAAEAKLSEMAKDPLSAVKTINKWEGIKIALDNGETPPEQLTLDFLNEPNASGRDLARRFAANKLSGALSAVYPSPGGKGLFFEATLTGPDGRQYVAPLTKNKTITGAPGSEKDEVEEFSIEKLINFGQSASEVNKAAILLAQKGGLPGAQLAVQIMMERDKSRREALIKEWEHQRERGEKRTDKKEEREWKEEQEKSKQKHELTKIEKQKDVKFIGDADNGYWKYDPRTDKLTPVGEASQGPSANKAINIDGKPTKLKDATKEFYIDLPKVFSSSKIVYDEETFAEEKMSLVSQAEDVIKNSKSKNEVNAAKRWLRIGKELGVFGEDPVVQDDGLGNMHGGSSAANGFDQKAFEENLAKIKAAKGQPKTNNMDLGTSHKQINASQTPEQKSSIMRSFGRALAKPSPEVNPLEMAVQGLSKGAALATPAMVEGIQGLPNSAKETLMQRLVVEKWTIDQLASAIREIQAGYQEQNAIK